MSRRFLLWYWSATGGGGSQFAVNLAHRLSLRFGADAVRLSLHGDDPLNARAASFPFETLTAAVTTRRRQALATAMALPESAATLRRHAAGCDCVIVPMNFAAAAPLSLVVQQPLVYVAHDPEPHPGDYAPAAQRITQDVLLARSARVLALSSYAADRLRSRSQGLAGKVRAAPLSAVFAPSASAPVRADGPVRLLFAGRMIAYKGLSLLAEALTTGIGGDWTLAVAGDGPDLDAAMRRRLAYPNVSIEPGWMSEAALNTRIAACDILLAPYTSATQSGVVSQALAHGKPCIVTPVGALAEQIGGGRAGWVAENATAPAVAAAIGDAVRSADERARKAAAAAQCAAEAWQADYWQWLEEL